MFTYIKKVHSKYNMLAKTPSNNVAANFVAVRQTTEKEFRGQKSEYEILLEAAKRFQKLGSKAKLDLNPVDKSEATTLFEEYYRERYPDRDVAEAKMSGDINRKTKTILKPLQRNSYLYRPRRDESGSLLRSGPEIYDFQGVDDGLVRNRLKQSG